MPRTQQTKRKPKEFKKRFHKKSRKEKDEADNEDDGYKEILKENANFESYYKVFKRDTSEAEYKIRSL